MMFTLKLNTRLTATACTSMGLSVREVAEAYKLEQYDTALPQGFVDECIHDHKFDPRAQVVWYYAKGDCLGRPFPLTREMEYQFKKVGFVIPVCPAEEE